MKDHIAILQLASRNELPESIDRKNVISLQVASELIRAGYLTGMHVTSTNGATIFRPAITLSGRQFLEEQKKRIGFTGWLHSSWAKIKPLIVWAAGILAVVIAAYLTKLLGAT